MKLLYLVLISWLILFGCTSEGNKQLAESEAYKYEPHITKVIDKIPAKGYTYLQVTENKKDYWIAIPMMEIEVGETVYFSRFMIMEDFTSQNIDKSFDQILFVEDARKSPTPDEMEKIHSGVLTSEKQDINIEPLVDGKTIQQIFGSKFLLKDKDYPNRLYNKKGSRSSLNKPDKLEISFTW